MPRRWRISTPAWTCGQTSEASGKDEGHAIRQIHRAPQLRRAGDRCSAGTPGGASSAPTRSTSPSGRPGCSRSIFLILTLLVTPVSRIARWSWLGQFRRMLGLCAFFHASLHFLIFFGFDRGASASGTLSEIIKRPYLMVGTIGLVLMVPLAATSTDGMIRRLGGKRWKMLHRLAYVVAVAGVVHYYMLVKADVTQPVAFAVALAVLLGYRLVAHYLQLRSAYHSSIAPVGSRRRACG